MQYYKGFAPLSLLNNYRVIKGKRDRGGREILERTRILKNMLILMYYGGQ
jgi:hypothetical protein